MSNEAVGLVFRRLFSETTKSGDGQLHDDKTFNYAAHFLEDYVRVLQEVFLLVTLFYTIIL